MVLVCAPVWAASLELLGPDVPVPPEGFTVAVVRRDAGGQPVAFTPSSVTAEGAELKPGPESPPLRTYVVVPQARAREVVVRVKGDGEEAQARYDVGPPASRMELSLEPALPVKGRDTEATLTVKRLRPDGTPDDSGAPPVLRASTGQVEGLQRTGPGTYTARYVLPPTRLPEAAILVALSAWPHPQSVHGAYGRLLVPLATSVNLPGQSEPGGQVSLEVAGTRFGPVPVDAQGRFVLPLVVPPGYSLARGEVKDESGHVERLSIDLQLPPTDGLACVLNPQRLPADGVSQARLLCATSDPKGQPVAEARVTAKAKYGRLEGPQRDANGMLEWRYTAPRTLAADERIDAAWPQRGPGSRESLPMQLVQGPVRDVTVSLPEPLVHAGSVARLVVTARDAAGQPRPEAKVVVTSPLGTPGPAVESPPGTYTVPWTAPESGWGSSTDVTVAAYGPVGTEPARLAVWARGPLLVAGVVDLAGWPVPRQPLRVNGLNRSTGEDGTVILGGRMPGTLRVSHAVWPGLDVTVHVLGPQGPVFPDSAPLVPAPVVQRVELAPPLPVNVRVRVEGARVTCWVEDASGQVLKDRPVHIALSEGERGDLSVQDGLTRFTVQGVKGPVSVSVADVRTGVTAVEEVRP
ncbi:Ig-like domain-containing protein [Corallococcus coralloides]|uniref:Ig-like domain-containing protein n=1 Tax=Corallococcus coralloides TaxID=184914 RepID=UPI00384E2773